ncbi:MULTISPECIES: hypothetical protein [Pseudofrankia]|uniref:hypothetical protein n=1 Tax=Pseudofrankia TaxID=2994363 RepID=UPI000234B6DB|nr:MULTISPECIES: hypothetical protein [Pseudofrankia]
MEQTTGVTGSGAAPRHPELVAVARALTASADYGSLALWSGRVAHGLRFTTRRLDGTPNPAAAQKPTSLGSVDLRKKPAANLDAAWPVAAVDRLVLLAPLAIGRLLIDGDQACRFQFCGPVAGQTRWVSVAFGGWVAAVPAADTARLTEHFADRHPTGDLFDLGERWAMLEIDVVEAFVRTEHSGTRLDTGDARSLLAS